MTDTRDFMPEIVKKLENIRNRSAVFSQKWREWAATQPQTRFCPDHQFTRKLNEAVSMSVSWHDREFRLIYEKCPQCIKETRELVKPQARQPYAD